jgi:hypothetical protein
LSDEARAVFIEDGVAIALGVGDVRTFFYNNTDSFKEISVDDFLHQEARNVVFDEGEFLSLVGAGGGNG